jgi:uncharacterized membrane protein
MYIDRSALKQDAKSKIQGNVLTIFFSLLIVGLIPGILLVAYRFFLIKYIPIAYILISSYALYGMMYLIAIPLSLGRYSYFLTLSECGHPDFSEMFFAFKNGLGAFFKLIITFILMFLIIMFWSIFLIVPGIIKAYQYSQVFYIRAEDPDIGVFESLKMSKEMMKGHKGELFLLQLTFIGWFFLAPFTLGLIYIYVIPFLSTTLACYYSALKDADKAPKEKKTEEKKVISETPAPKVSAPGVFVPKPKNINH